MCPELVTKIRWGRKWGRMKIEKGFDALTYWGAEVNAGDVPLHGRQPVRLIRGKILPCNTCKNRVTCSMYKSFTRNRLRSPYMQNTNILHMCDIYVRQKSP